MDLADMMPDGIMFIAGNGNLYTRDEVLTLNERERAEAGLLPIGSSNELIAKRKLQIETRMKAAPHTSADVWG
ncbi:MULTISPECIES: hypothetical protein [unclassified Mesorhizobium]|uniref:hypothetical protein n=1 Tax=unclassified Mesorhizobium TaxID=325217 RepID=UPI0033385485